MNIFSYLFHLPLLFIITFVNGKIYDRCELARELRLTHELSEFEAAMWTCIAEKQSTLDTNALTGAGTHYHGIFQISDEFWCAPPNNAYVCDLHCDSLRDDDISDDLKCARQHIYEEHQRISGDGYNAWPSYQSFCKYNWQIYVSECLAGILLESDAIASSFAQRIANQYKTTMRTTTTVRPVNNPSPPLYVSSFNNLYKSESDAIALSFAKNLLNRYKTTSKPAERPQARKIQTKEKIYEPCELADELFNRHSIPIEQIATWICIAKHESNFNTAAVGYLNWDGSGDHGLFQISDLYWCGINGPGKACSATCSDFEDDDITDDVQCIKQIHAEHQRLSGNGFNAWAVYQPYCQGDVSSYIDNCPVVNTIEPEVTPEPFKPRPAITAPPKPYSAKTIERGKIYSACELADELLNVYNFPIEQISTWVCIAYHESNYVTSAVGRLNWDGSGDHGLFQISDIYWCGLEGAGKGCNAACTDFEDGDITDDVQCIKTIYDEHQRLFKDGFHAWAVYEPYCKANTKSYVQGCFDNEVVSPYERTTKALWSSYSTSTKPKKPRGKVYDRCELARELYEVHRLPWEQVGTWTCIAEYESSFNTAAIGQNQDHGLFQISDIYWCNRGYAGKGCGIDCNDLEDNDLSDDVECIKRIYAEHTLLSGDGFNAWTVYQPRCKGRSVNYVVDCFAQPTQRTTAATPAVTSVVTNNNLRNRFQFQTKRPPQPQLQRPRQQYTQSSYKFKTTSNVSRFSKQIIQNLTSTFSTSTTQRSTMSTTTRRPSTTTSRQSTSTKTTTERVKTTRPLTTSRTTSRSTTTRKPSTTTKLTTQRVTTLTTKKPSSLSPTSKQEDLTQSTWRKAFDIYLNKSTKTLPTFKPFKSIDSRFTSKSSSSNINSITTTTKSTRPSTARTTTKFQTQPKPKLGDFFTSRTTTTRSPTFTTTKRSTTRSTTNWRSRSTTTPTSRRSSQTSKLPASVSKLISTSTPISNKSSQNVIKEDSDKPKNAWEFYVKHVLKGKYPVSTPTLTPYKVDYVKTITKSS